MFLVIEVYSVRTFPPTIDHVGLRQPHANLRKWEIDLRMSRFIHNPQRDRVGIAICVQEEWARSGKVNVQAMPPDAIP